MADSTEMMSIKVYLDRSADIFMSVTVKRGTTLQDVKQEVVASDPTGSIRADEIVLGLPAEAPGAPPTPLPESMKLDESYWRFTGLEICPEGTVQPKEDGLTEENPLEALQQQGDPLEVLKQEAAEALEEGNAALALEKINKAIELGSHTVPMLTKRAQILLRLGRVSSAVEDCSTAIRMDPDSSKAWKLRGKAHAKLAEWRKAVSDLKEALKICPDDDDAEEQLETAKAGVAEILLEEKAEEERAEQAMAEKHEAEVREKAAQAEAKREANRQTWELLCEVPVRDSLSPFSRVDATRLARGAVVKELDLEGDNLNFEKVSGDGPEKGWFSTALNGMIIAYRRFPPPPAAMLGLGSNDEPPFPAMAGCHWLAEDPTDAHRDRLALLKQQASEALDDEEPDLALMLLTEVVATSPANAILYSRRGDLLLQMERPGAAINDCTAALKVNAESGKALKSRARAYCKLERWPEAHADFQAALKYDYDDEAYKESVVVAAKVCQLWEVLGGATTGGIMVREGQALFSAEASQRLACGATVREVELVGDRLHYQKVAGRGPDEGWVSIALNGKVLMCRVSAVRTTDAEDEHVVAAQEEDEPPFPAMAPPEHRRGALNEAELDKQASLKQLASEALEDGDYTVALEKLTQAIIMGSVTALMYSKRAEVLLKLGRPRAVINDCTAALGINPDSAKALAIRGRAHLLLKDWVEAHDDFQESLKIDYDDGIYQEAQRIAERARGIRTVANEKRRLEEENERKRQAEKEEKARQAAADAQRQEEKDALALAEVNQNAMRANVAKVENDPRYAGFLQTARRQGYMADFMGKKRGRCTCGKCPVFVWRPVKLSSCAAASVPVDCLICGCPADKHVNKGAVTDADLRGTA